MSAVEIAHRVREAGRKRSPVAGCRAGRATQQAPLMPALPGLRERLLRAPSATRQAIAASADAFAAAVSKRWAEVARRLLRPAFPGFDLDARPAHRQVVAGGTSAFASTSATGSSAASATSSTCGNWAACSSCRCWRPMPCSTAIRRLGRAVHAAIDSWYEHNPPFGGVHWAELLNVAIRAINLLVAVSIMRRAPARTKRSRACVRCWPPMPSLLSLFPSLHSSANNHLVAERAAEYLIARCAARPADVGPRAGAWPATA